MCKAIEDIRREGYEEGYKEGLKESIKGTIDVLRSVGISNDDMVNKIAGIFSLNEEDAKCYVYDD